MEDMAVTSANQIGGYSGVDGDRCSYLNHEFYYLDKKKLSKPAFCGSFVLFVNFWQFGLQRIYRPILKIGVDKGTQHRIFSCVGFWHTYCMR